MTNTITNVSVGKPKVGGAIFVAPEGTAVPVSAVATLGDAFKNIGYASEEGLTNTIETESESIMAWGGDEVLNLRTSRAETWTFTAIETNEATLRLAYGTDNVTKTEGGIAVIHNGKEHPCQVVVFEIALSDERVKRIVLPRAKVSAVGDVVYVDNAPVGYNVTLSSLPDAQGNTAYEYIASVAGGK